MANQPNIPITSSFNDRGIRDAKRQFESLGDSIRKTGRDISAAGQSMTRNLTVPLVGVGAAVVTASANFETGMNRVKALTNATADDFAELRDQAKLLGRTTMFSASQAADAMGFLAMAGFKANDILGAMPSTLSLAAAAQIDLATAADITSNILTGYGLTVEELTHANDVLVKTFTSANTDLVMLGEAMKYAAPVASAAGIQFEQAAAALGLMGNAGIQASMAGTSLRGSITRLLTPSNEAADTMDQLGLNVLDASGNLVGLDEIIRQLEASGATTADMMTIFGQRAGPAMMALVSQGSDALVDFTSELENAGGTAERVASVQMEGFNGALTELKSAAEGAMIAIGDAGLLEALTQVAEQTTILTQALATVDPELLKMGTIVAAVVAALGPAIFLFGKFVTLIGVIASPLGLTVVALAALAAGAYYLYTNFEQVRQVVDNVAAAVVSFTQGALAWLQTKFDQIEPTLQRVGQIAQEVFAVVVQAVQDAIPPIVSFVTDVVERLVHIWGVVSAAVSDFVAAAIETLTPFAGWMKDNVFDTIVAIVNFLVETVKGVGKLLKPTIEFIIKLFKHLAGMVVDALQGIVTVLRASLETLISMFIGFADVVKPIFETLWETIKFIVIVAFEFIENTIEVALAVIRGIFNAGAALLKGDFGAVWDAIKQMVEDAFNAIGDFMRTWFDTTINFIKNIDDSIDRAARGMFDGIKNAFKDAINFIIRGWNALEFRVPGFSIGPIGYDGFTLGVPDIPMLADGGIVNRATLAVIGEAGPEAVVPLSKAGSNGFGGSTYNITVQAGVGDPGQIGQSVVEAIAAYERRNGAGWRAA